MLNLLNEYYILFLDMRNKDTMNCSFMKRFEVKNTFN